MPEELDKIILRREIVKDRAEDDEVISLLNEIIDDLCEGEEVHLKEKVTEE